VKLGIRKSVKRKAMDVFSYKMVGMKRGSKGRQGGGMYGGVQQEQGGRGAVGTHLAYGYYMGP
jgi:hypothetical protein